MVQSAVPIPVPPDLKSTTNRFPLRAFYAGPENSLARQAFESFTSVAAGHLNPLVVHGPTSVGKSQFVRCVIDRWKQVCRGKNVVEVQGKEFAKQFGEAVRSDTLRVFRRQFENIHLFILEDLHHFTRAEATQREFLHLFDRLHRSGVSLVITSRYAPVLLDGLLPALTSRLASGLTVPIVPSGTAARNAMLRDLSEIRRTRISANALNRLARESLFSTIDVLETAESLLSLGKSVDIRDVQQAIRQRIAASHLTTQQIARCTAAHFAISTKLLKSSSRRRNVVLARGVTIHLARLLTNESLESIGMALGKRDHTTILHHAKKMQRLVTTDQEVQNAVDAVKQRLA
ncbi:MAG: AAA family ATPase [Planctomycetales bacterium]|nr:AAA family ATPase [Planctomycetales bacterium]